MPPPIAEGEAADPRRLAFVRRHKERSATDAAMHIFEIDATMEDTEILGMAFHGQQMTLPVEGYRKWWRSADLTETYEYHRRVVKLLGSRRPPELWLFKAPHHKFHLEALSRVYPEMRFVMTHRDPAKVVPSYTSLAPHLVMWGQRLCDAVRDSPAGPGDDYLFAAQHVPLSRPVRVCAMR